MNEYQEFKAKTVDEAITNAMIELETTTEHLDYEILEKGSSGFLGIGAKPAIIKARKIQIEEPETIIKKPVKKEKPQRKEKEDHKQEKNIKKDIQKEAKKEIKKEEKVIKEASDDVSLAGFEEQDLKEQMEKKPQKEVVTVDVAPLIPKAEEFLQKVFRAMEMEVSIDIKAGEEINTIEIDLSGDDMGVLIGKRGQTLDSLQYLTSIIVNADQSEYIRVKVDTENYRNRRKETLENLAKNVAGKVKRTNHAVSLEPMNPYERRIIHSALQKDKYVDTHSEGEEPYRKVVLTPTKNCKNYNGNRKSYGNRRYSRKPAKSSDK